MPIIKTEAARGEGVEALAEKLAEHRAHVEAEGTLSERRRRNLMNEVLGIATMRLRRALEATLRDDPEVQELLDEVVARRLDPASAASAVLARGAIDPGAAARPDVAQPYPMTIRPVRVAIGDRRALESRHAEGDRCVRLRRGLCAALSAPALAAPRTASSRRSSTAAWSRSTPTAAGCARCRVTDAGEITGLAWSPDGNRLAFVARRADRRLRRSPPGAARRRDRRRRATRTRAGRRTARGSGSGAGWRRSTVPRPPAGDAAAAALARRSAATTQIAWAPDLSGVAAVVAGAARCCPGRAAPASSARRRGRRTASRIAFADADGLSTIPAAGGEPDARSRRAPAASPRWSPDGARARLSRRRRAAHASRSRRRAADGARRAGASPRSTGSRASRA